MWREAGVRLCSFAAANNFVAETPGIATVPPTQIGTKRAGSARFRAATIFGINFFSRAINRFGTTFAICITPAVDGDGA
jgi:hypothetical protein